MVLHSALTHKTMFSMQNCYSQLNQVGWCVHLCIAYRLHQEPLHPVGLEPATMNLEGFGAPFNIYMGCSLVLLLGSASTPLQSSLFFMNIVNINSQKTKKTDIVHTNMNVTQQLLLRKHGVLQAQTYIASSLQLTLTRLWRIC